MAYLQTHSPNTHVGCTVSCPSDKLSTFHEKVERSQIDRQKFALNCYFSSEPILGVSNCAHVAVVVAMTFDAVITRGAADLACM